MSFWLVSFVAGFLTVLAPCSLFLLPTIVVGSSAEKDRKRPWIIVGAMGLSVFLFSIIIKASSLALTISDQAWGVISGLLLVFVGLGLLLPSEWDRLAKLFRLDKSKSLLVSGSKRKGKWGAFILGASLGPVFSACSPTFAILLATVLPNSFISGVVNIALFVLGMVIPFVIIAVGGQKVLSKFKFFANPNGWFKKILAWLLIMLGLMVMTGVQKKIEQAVIEAGYLGPINFEQSLLEMHEDSSEDMGVDPEIGNKLSY